MIADNNLDYYAVNNINEIEKGVSDGIKQNSSVYIFIDRARKSSLSHPVLYKAVSDSSSAIKSQIELVYPELNSSNPKNLRQVIDDVQVLARKNNEILRGIVLWSHGSSWLPQGNRLTSIRGEIGEEEEELRSFGLDEDNSSSENSEMNLLALAQALEGLKFEYLIFDACFMGAIEVVYELRNNFNYIISSPTEILASGFPYREVIPYLLREQIDYKAICNTYINSYQKKKGILKSASISLIKASELEPFAKSFKHILSEKLLLNSVVNSIQLETSNANLLFDIYSIIEQIQNPIDKKLIENELSNIIQYYKHTDFFFAKIPLSKTRGLSIFIPNQSIKDASIEIQYYKKTSWSRDTGLYQFLGNYEFL